MPLLKCPECGGNVSDSAAACPHCGLPIQEVKKSNESSPSATSNLESENVESDPVSTSMPEGESPKTDERDPARHQANQDMVSKSEVADLIRIALSMLGGLLLIAGAFLPFLKAPGEQYSSIFGNGTMYGSVIVGWGLLTFGFASARRFKDLKLPGFLSGAIVAALYWALSSQPNSSSLEFGFAWLFLLCGSALVLLVGIIPGKNKSKVRAVLWIVCVILGLISIGLVFSTISASNLPEDKVGSTQRALGIGEDGLSGLCTISTVEVNNIPARKPNGSAWDPLNGAPDPMLHLYLNDRIVYTSNAISDRYTSLRWYPDVSIDFADASVLEVHVIDEDAIYHDPICTIRIDTEDLRWGNNHFSTNIGITVDIKIE